MACFMQLQRPADNADDNSPYFVRRWAPKVNALNDYFVMIAEESVFV